MSSGIVMPFFRSRIFARARTLSGAPAIDDLSIFGEVKAIGVEARRLLRLLLFVNSNSAAAGVLSATLQPGDSAGGRAQV